MEGLYIIYNINILYHISSPRFRDFIEKGAERLEEPEVAEDWSKAEFS